MFILMLFSYYLQLVAATDVQEIVGKTINGTTYVGLDARTSAPQNHSRVETT